MKKILLIAILIFSAQIIALSDRLSVPEGFQVDVFSSDIKNPRQMALGNDFLFVGTKEAGVVYALPKSNPEEKIEILTELNSPTGVALHNGDLYVAEIDKIIKIDNIEMSLKTGDIKSEIYFENLPRKKMFNPLKKMWHGWKWIAFGPDDKLYLSEGVPCNVCEEKDERFGSILQIHDGNYEIYADGVRNSVGFAWHPISEKMYFTDNGRDWMGDDIPPCELNKVSYKGEHFGFPYFHGNDISDDSFNAPEDFSYTKPVWGFQAHTAPLGIDFYTGNMFPEKYKNGAFIAQRGSWNRSKKVGYRVLFAEFKDDEIASMEVFVDGWLDGETSLGRPSSVLMYDDGSLLVSDDTANKIFKISYSIN